MAEQCGAGGPEARQQDYHESKGAFLTLQDVHNLQELKRGRYSVVYKGECLGYPDMRVAVKLYEKPSLTPKKQKMATREAIVLKYLNSQGVPNITHMWSAYASQDMFHIIMEFCEGGNLLDFLKAQQPHVVTERWLATAVAAPLLHTLASMHAVGVTHRDIKLENIFLDASGRVKLGDFDLAVFHHEAQARAPVGTIFYMAPEVLLLASYKGSALEAAVSKRVGEKMDVWSLGVCLFELAAGYKPFQGVSYEGIAAAVIQHAMADLPPHLSPAFKSFMAAALTYDPQQRPSAQQLMDHPWLQVHLPSTAVRSDSAGSLLDAVHVKGGAQGYMLQRLLNSKQCASPASAATAAAAGGSRPSLSRACSAASLQHHHQLQMQVQQCQQSPACPAANTSGSSTDAASSLTGSSCSSSALKYSKDQLYCAGGSSCGGGAAAAGAASISVTATSGAAVESYGFYPAGGERLFDRSLGPFAGAASAAAAAIGGGVAGAAVVPPVYCPAGQPWAGSACPGVHAGHSPFGPYASIPGIPRVRSTQHSLGTHVDWGSTHDSCYAASPRSVMQRMGLSSSSSLARHLVPWASAGSGSLSAAASFNTTGQGPGAVLAAATAAAASGSPHGAAAVAVPGSSAELTTGQAAQQGTGADRSSSWMHSAVGGVSPSSGSVATQARPQMVPGQQQMGSAPHADRGSQHSSSTRVCDVRHSRSSSGGGSSSSGGVRTTATPDGAKLHGQRTHWVAQSTPQVQQHANGAALRPAGPAATGAGSNNPAGAGQPQTHPDAAMQAASAAAAAAAAAATSSQITPLALAVAAAVADHNKHQPRRWTPFALRVHQLRVAQVLLAERQKQVAAQQQQQQPAYQLQAPVQHIPAEQQQNQQQTPVEHRVHTQQQDAAPAATQAASATPGEDASFARQHPGHSAAGARVQDALCDSSASGSACAPVAAGSAQQKQEKAPTAAAAGAEPEADKGQKPGKKKWLACFAPRAFS